MDIKKEQRAIKYLQSFQPESEPYYLCYSGGKDSDCIRILAELADVNYGLEHNHTTVDAPETVHYVRSIPGVHINYPPMTMWQLIVEKRMPPTRLARYCCEVLKERGGKGKMKVTGVRWAESSSRKESSDLIKIIGKPATTRKAADTHGIEYRVTKKGGIVLNDDNAETRRFVEFCYRTTATILNPIVDWTDEDVWEFLHYYGCDSNPLYQCGWNRVGCVGCPLQNFKGMRRDFAKYPKYRAAYVRAFDKMLVARKRAGLPNSTKWVDGEHVMRWWIGEDPLQLSLFDYLESKELEELLE